MFSVVEARGKFWGKNRAGVTLIETLLVVSIMGAIMIIALSQLNPGTIMATGRNGVRWVEIEELLGAITAFTIENDGVSPPNVQLPSIPGPTSYSGAYIIDTPKSPRSTRIIDVDGDSDLDIVMTSSQGSEKDVTWYEQSGTAPYFTWTVHIIDNSNWKGYDVEANDIDGDTDIDFAAVDNAGRDIAWWQNQGGSPPSFGSRIYVDSDFRGVTSLHLVDMDNDTDLDVLAGSDTKHAEAVRFYRNDGTPTNPDWSYKDIEDSKSVNYSVNEVLGVDIDGDGDIDVLGAGINGSPFLWENDGTPWGNNWDRYALSATWDNTKSIGAGDVDGDLDIDVVAISTSHYVSWFENDGSPMQDSWTEHQIATNFGGDSILVDDIDLDLDLDVLGGSLGGDKLAYWENMGSGTFSGTYIIGFGDEVDGINDIFVLDIDSDGDRDIAAANKDGWTVTWWDNLVLSSVSDPAPVASVIGVYKPVCRQGVPVVECDANGGVSVDVLIPGYTAQIPVDSMQGEEGEQAVLTGYEIRHDYGSNQLSIRAPLAELGEEIELTGPIGIHNCLIWDIVYAVRTCIVFE